MEERFSKEAEQELIRRGQAGDIEARNRVVMSVNSLCWCVAKRYSRGNRHVADQMHSYAIEVLCTKFPKFSFSFDCRFTTWAYSWARQACTRWLQLHSHHGIRLPANNTPNRYQAHASQAGRVVSADQPIADRGGKELVIRNELVDHRERTASSTAERREKVEFVRRVLSRLHPRYRQILELRMKYTFEEAGQVLGFTRERVRQLEAKAHQKFLNEANAINAGMIDEIEEEARSSYRADTLRRKTQSPRRTMMTTEAKRELLRTIMNENPNAKYKTIHAAFGAKVQELGEEARLNDADIAAMKRELLGKDNMQKQRKPRAPKGLLTLDLLREIKQKAVAYGGLQGLQERLKEIEPLTQLAEAYGGTAKLSEAIEFMLGVA